MRDLERKKELDASYRPLYKTIRVKVRKDSGIMEALDRVKAKTGQGPSVYAQNAVKKRLIRDGYLPLPDNQE